MLQLAGGIAELGYPVDLLLTRGGGPFVDEISAAVRVVDLEASRALTSLPRLVCYLRSVRPHALLSALGYINVVAIWAKFLARVDTQLVVSEHNTLSISARHGSNRRLQLMPHLIRRFYPWADGIVAVSGGVADDLAQAAGIPRDSVRVIYNPAITPQLRARAGEPLTHPWFGAGQPPVVLGVGRLRPQKDFPSLIRAFARVRQARRVRLLILGEGSERGHLEGLVRQLGLTEDVSLPGFVVNPYPYMARASVFVLSSRWEGLPGVLIEALYCGAPVVATDCPSGPREILAGGSYGTLVPPGDVSALATAIDSALAGRTPRPPPESWRPFGVDVVVGQYLEALMGGR